jgi:hypothetical protein
MPTLLRPALHAALDPALAEKLIRGAKARSVPFAFGLGATPDRSVLAVDKSKAGKSLFEICRKEGGAQKGAYGTVRIEGSTAVFACEKDGTPDLAKAVLAYFKANGIALKVALAPPPGPLDDPAREPPPGVEEGGTGRAEDDRAEDEAGEDEAEEDEEDEDVPEGRVYDPEVIVPLIRKAKKTARPFALGVAPDRTILAMHPKMDPVRLAKMVRAEGATKGVWGRVLLDGSVAVFACEKEPFSGVRKGLKRWLKDRELTLKFRVEGPEGPFDEPDEDDAGGIGGGAGGPVDALRREALAALEAAEAESDPVLFVKRVETARIKADLLADTHGDRAAATELVGRAFALVKARRAQGFDAAAYPALRTLADRAFKFGVVKGGLKGGSNAPALLKQAAAALERGEPESVLTALMGAYAEAAKSGADDLVAECAKGFEAAGHRFDNPEFLFNGAVLLGRLNPAAAVDMGFQAAKMAGRLGNASVLRRSAENLLRLGTEEARVSELIQLSAAIAFDRKEVGNLVAAGEALLDLGSPPAGHVREIALQAASMARGGKDLETSAATAQLLARAASAHRDEELLNLAREQALRTAGLAAEAGNRQAMVNCAQALTKLGLPEKGMQVAAEAGRLALAAKEADAALDAVRFLTRFDPAQTPGLQDTILELTGGVLSAFPVAADVQMELAWTVLGVGGTKIALAAVEIARDAAGKAARDGDPAKAEAYLSMAGGVMFDAAESLATEAPDQACDLAWQAGHIACRSLDGMPADTGQIDTGRPDIGQVDAAQALRAARFLSRAGKADQAATLARSVAAVEQRIGNLAREVGDADALIDSIQRLCQVAALSPKGMDGAEMLKQVTGWAEAVDAQTEPADLDTRQRLCAVLREAGLKPVALEQKTGEASFKAAEAILARDDWDERYGEALAHLQTAFHNAPATAGPVRDVLGKLRGVLEGAEVQDEDSLLDIGYLLTEIFAETQDKTILDDAADIARAVGGRALAEGLGAVAARAEELLRAAAALAGSPLDGPKDQAEGIQVEPTVKVEVPLVEVPLVEVMDKSGYNYSKQITKVKKHKAASVVHYASKGKMSTQQREEVEKFAERVTRSANSAREELVRSNFKDWEDTGSHLMQMLKLQADWHQVNKDKALFYDLQKLRTLQSGKTLENDKYSQSVSRDAKAAGWPDNLDSAKYLDLRKEALKEKDARVHAESRSLKMLHAVAGYLIEERIYQLLPSRDEVPWTDQDTEILGGGTRPDITLPVKDAPNLYALLDITATDSQGHIFDKRPEWTKSQKVGDAAEILYDSIDHGTLQAVMLDKVSFSPEEVAQRQAALSALRQKEEARKNDVVELIQDALLVLGGEGFRKAVGGMTPAIHLLKQYGVKRKGFRQVKAINKDAAARALLDLEAAELAVPAFKKYRDDKKQKQGAV